MNKNIRKFGKFFTSISLIIVSVSMITIGNCKRMHNKHDEEKGLSTVTFVKGQVKVNDKEIKPGESIDDLATITTGENSICEITFQEKNIIQIQSQSEITLNFVNLIKGIELKKGSVASILKNLEIHPGEDGFRIKTNTTVAGVRGTTFFLHTDGEKTYVCDCNGSVNVSDVKNTHSELMKSLRHTARVFSMVDGKIKVEAGALLYHDDKMMEELAAKINYKIDWEKPD
jgi:hypothetical protein